MKNRTFTGSASLCLLTGLACLTGCSTINTVERAQPIAQKQMVADKRVITDSSLNRKVQILGVNESTGAGGLLRIQVEVFNTTRSLQHFSYKFEWFDESANQINTPSSVFLSRQIEGKESMFLKATAPVETARDFRLKLKED